MMTKSGARKLVELYVEGWKENSVSKILKPLVSDCKIVESHGPIYKGTRKVKKWVEVWIASGEKVKRWDITSFYFTDNIALFEWIFECVVNKKSYYIEGISIVHFRRSKISYLREYRMTKKAFEWDETEIKD